MNNRFVGMASFILVLLSLVALVCLFAFEPGIRGLVNIEIAAWGALAICLVGFGLGWASMNTSEGMAAIAVSLVVLLLALIQLVRSPSM